MNKLRLIIIFIVTISVVSCEKPTQFSEEALNDVLTSMKGDELSFRNIINQYIGKKVVIDVWASWCGDCLKGLPKVSKLQEDNPNVVFLFLSLDRNEQAWKKALAKYKIKGEHYYLTSGEDGAFRSFLNSNWIPRYMVLDEQGNIALFKATKATDKRIKQILQ